MILSQLKTKKQQGAQNSFTTSKILHKKEPRHSLTTSKKRHTREHRNSFFKKTLTIPENLSQTQNKAQHGAPIFNHKLKTKTQQGTLGLFHNLKKRNDRGEGKILLQP